MRQEAMRDEMKRGEWADLFIDRKPIGMIWRWTLEFTSTDSWTGEGLSYSASQPDQQVPTGVVDAWFIPSDPAMQEHYRALGKATIAIDPETQNVTITGVGPIRGVLKEEYPGPREQDR